MVLRKKYLDCLRGFAIILVIFGHLLSNCVQMGNQTFVHAIVYSIHIPLFLVISGVLANDKPLNRFFFKKVFYRFVVPYTFWCFILFLFYTGRKILDFQLLEILNRFIVCWLCDYLWFIKVYVFVLIVWIFLRKLEYKARLLCGTIVLIVANVLALRIVSRSEFFSLSLYVFTIFGIAICVKQYVEMLKFQSTMIVLFLLLLPFAKPEYDYFRASFAEMVYNNSFWIFFL